MNNNFDDETLLHAMDVEDLIGVDISDDVIEHWGIKGQKWGVRKYRNKDGTLTEAGKKRYLELEEKQNKLRAEQGKLETGKDPTIDVSRDKNGKKITKNHKNMTDEELAQRTTRLRLEAAYLDAATERNAKEAQHKTIEKTKEMQAEIAYKEAYNKLHPKKESAIKKFFEKNGETLIKAGTEVAKEYIKHLGLDDDEDEKKQKPETTKKTPKPKPKPKPEEEEEKESEAPKPENKPLELEYKPQEHEPKPNNKPPDHEAEPEKTSERKYKDAGDDLDKFGPINPMNQGRSFLAKLFGAAQDLPDTEATESRMRQLENNQEEQARRAYKEMSSRAEDLREQLARAERAGRYAEKQTINRELTPLLEDMKRERKKAKQLGYSVYD